MRILILGGTRFLGRALVEAALEEGHQVTLFHRGLTNPDLFPDVEKLIGDRDGGLAVLSGRRWDAVIDTCGYFPRAVRQSAEALKDATSHYTFVSTLSVYADTSTLGIDESAPLAPLDDESIEEITGESYGPLKVLCERVVSEVFPGRSLIIRPGLIVGPHDPTDRFTYWPCRVARGGKVLAPGRPERPVQYIDVRDLAEWTIRMVADRCTGEYNAVGRPMPIGELLEACRRVSGAKAEFTWVSETFLEKEGVGPWMEMPLWIPESDTSSAGFMAFDASMAVDAGLRFRPMEETIRATLDWARGRPERHEWRAGISDEREKEILSVWDAVSTSLHEK
jgi:2'-hydroxyisoflavone reductase